MVAVTRLLLEKGASVLAVDCNGMTPALACAPDPNVAECLAIILSMYPSVTLLTQQPNNFQKGEGNKTSYHLTSSRVGCFVHRALLSS
jgi:ankyrin repeat protein